MWKRFRPIVTPLRPFCSKIERSRLDLSQIERSNREERHGRFGNYIDHRIHSIENYYSNLLHGPKTVFNQRSTEIWPYHYGQLNGQYKKFRGEEELTRINYSEGQKNGPARRNLKDKTIVCNYRNDKLDGIYQVYVKKNGRLQLIVVRYYFAGKYIEIS